MRVERQDIKTAFLLCSLHEYRDIPEEVDIEHSFSNPFQQNMRNLFRKSESSSWRCWNTYRRRIILVAVIIALFVTLVACAPIIKKLYIEYFFVEHDTYYGITFDLEQAASAPDRIETHYVPTWEPEGYILLDKSLDAIGTTYIWMTDTDDLIMYDQYLIPANATTSTWMTIDAERMSRKTEIMNEYSVEVFEDAEYGDVVAVWTDNAYLYKVTVSNTDSDKLSMVKAIMDSLVAVDPSELSS